jgi:hypothetical protein
MIIRSIDKEGYNNACNREPNLTKEMNDWIEQHVRRDLIPTEMDI